MKRTHLPLNALRVFDAAARHLSFTRAADELAVTPAAVGQQIRALEDVLGVVLFRRSAKGLELTAEAAAGLAALRAGFLHFEEAVQAMQAGQASLVFTIAAPRDLYAVWLAPHLASFRAAHGEARITVVDAETSDFTEANLDLAIRWAEGPGPLEGMALGAAAMVAVGGTGGSGGDAPWIAWPGDPAPGSEGTAPVLSVGDAGQALVSAAAGMGRAMVPELLAQAWQARGWVGEIGARTPGRRGYWLMAPLPQWRQAKVRALVAHLLAD